MPDVRRFELAFYLAPNPDTMAANLDVLAELGISHCGTDGFAAWRDPTFSRRIAGILSASGLQLQSYHASIGICHVGSGRIQQALDDNRRILDVAAEWGARHTVWHTRWFRGEAGDGNWADIQVMESMPRSEIDALMAEVLPASCAYAAELGIGVNLENLPLLTWSCDCHEILAMIRRLGIPNLGFILDSGHAWCSRQAPGEVIRAAGDLLRDTHFHDSRGPLGWDFDAPVDHLDIQCRDLHMIPGTGTIDWVDVVQALTEIDYPTPIVFEGPGIKGHPGNHSLELYRRCVDLTIRNWRTFEELAVYNPPLSQPLKEGVDV